MRKVLLIAAVVTLMAVPAGQAAADHGEPVDGLWWAVDVQPDGSGDGSFMLLRVRERPGGSGYFRVVFIDFLATGACDPPARFRGVDNDALFDDGAGNDEGRMALFVELDRLRCGRGSAPTADSFYLEFDVVDTDTLVDNFGIVWHHIRG